MINNGTLV